VNFPVFRRGLTLLVLLLGLLALAPTAGAASRNEILKDCEDDSRLSGVYSARELRDARNNINSGLDAYSDCRDVLGAALAADARRRRAQQNGGGGAPGGGTGGGLGSAIPSPSDGAASSGSLGTAPGAAPPKVSAAERRELRAAREELPEVDVRGQRVVAGVRGVAGSSADAGLPTPLIVVLIALAIAAILTSASLLRRRVLARRPA